jgi:hypothetical protein
VLIALASKITVSGNGSLISGIFIELTLNLVSLPASFNVWLASPEARFLRGKFLWANWDVDELKAKAKEIEEGTQLSIGLVGWPFEDDS